MKTYSAFRIGSYVLLAVASCTITGLMTYLIVSSMQG